MPAKNTNDPAQGLGEKKAKNLYLRPISVHRGLTVARELGYDLSEAVEKFLDLLWEERQKMGRRRHGDHLQLRFFDRNTTPEALPQEGGVKKEQKKK